MWQVNHTQGGKVDRFGTVCGMRSKNDKKSEEKENPIHMQLPANLQKNEAWNRSGRGEDARRGAEIEEWKIKFINTYS